MAGPRPPAGQGAWELHVTGHLHRGRSPVARLENGQGARYLLLQKGHRTSCSCGTSCRMVSFLCARLCGIHGLRLQGLQGWLAAHLAPTSGMQKGRCHLRRCMVNRWGRCVALLVIWLISKEIGIINQEINVINTISKLQPYFDFYNRCV